MALVVKSLFLDYLVTKGAINFRYHSSKGTVMHEMSYLKLIAPLVTHLLIHYPSIPNDYCIEG